MNKNTNMNNNTLVHKLSLSALLALLVLSLSACAEQLLEAAAEDPKPGVTPGEADYVTSQVMAQNSADSERSPQPNDINRNSYNDSDSDTGNDFDSLSRLVPIRIPLSGKITDLYQSNGEFNTTAASLYGNNILIFPSTGTSASDLVAPFPTHDRTGTDQTSNYGGTFKSVYQDSNNDLVLIPSINSNLAGSTVYFVIVKKSLNDTSGNALISDTLTQLLTTNNALINDSGTKINSALLEDIDGDGTPNDSDDLKQVSGLEQVRVTYVGSDGTGGVAASLGVDRNDIAGMFHFTTSEDSDLSTGVNGVLEVAETVDIDQQIVWLNSDMSGTTNSKEGLKAKMADILGSSYDLTFINEIYKGFFSCTNFLENEGKDSDTGADKWDLNQFDKLSSYYSASNDATLLADCPNSLSSIDSSLTGKVGFWAVKPTTTNLKGVVVFQHGIFGYKDNLFSMANTLAEYGYSSLAIDTWGHGERTYEDGDGDGTIENTMDNNYSDSGLLFIRPSAPDLTAGYMWQTMIDMYRLANMAKSNDDVQGATGVTDTTDKLHFVGVSLGGIHGSSFANLSSSDESGNALFSSFSDPFTKYVLNVTGGDVGAVILSGSIGDRVRAGVASNRGYDTSTVAGQESLSETMVVIELLASHAVFGLLTDPLASANESYPANVLLQEMTGDETVPNSNTELLTQSMALKSYNDGDEFVDTSNTGFERIRWRFDPDNYSKDKDGDPAGHGFLLDNDTNATAQGQLQVACYLRDGYVLNPAATINPSSCSN